MKTCIASFKSVSKCNMTPVEHYSRQTMHTETANIIVNNVDELKHRYIFFEREPGPMNLAYT